MGFSLLAPLFLLALAAVAVPVLVHLTARDRRDVVRFPSLRFLTRLPYRQVRRRRLRHPVLFALRTAAVVLLALAFARPYLPGAATTTAGEAGREAVIALDTSYSMAYGDAWERAVAAARDAAQALPAGARAALVTFADDARVVVPATEDHAAVVRALAHLAPGPGSTRFTPVLQLANELLLDAPASEREVVLVSDFQARGWDRSGHPELLAGVRLTAVDVGTAESANALVAGVETRREGDGVVLAARLVNAGAEAVRGLPVTAQSDGRRLAEARVDLAPASGETVRLGPIASPSEAVRVTVRTGGDPLPIDDVFHLTLSPRASVPLLLVEAADARGDASLYLREALAVAGEPAFVLERRAADRLRPADVEAAAVVVLHDVPFPDGAAGRALADRVAAGGGAWMILGSRSASRPEAAATLLPGAWRETVDRLDVLGVSLAGADEDHPVFAVFARAGAGNLAGPRFYRYRPIVLDEDEGVAALARYADGAVALAERRHGEGRVLLWGSPLDNRWSNLPVHPVFVPLVRQVCLYLSGGGPIAPSYRVGDTLDLSDREGALAAVTPAGLEIPLEEPLLRLDEPGFYAVRGDDAPIAVAVNVDRAESDLTRLDVEAFVAASTAAGDPSAPAVAGERSLTREESERRQEVWWWLVAVVLVLLGAESWWWYSHGVSVDRE